MKSIDCVCSSWETAEKQQRSDKPGNHSPEGVIIEPKTNDGIGRQKWVICCFPLGYMRTPLPWALHNLELYRSVLGGSRAGNKPELWVQISVKWIQKQHEENGEMRGKWMITSAGSAICHLWPAWLFEPWEQRASHRVSSPTATQNWSHVTKLTRTGLFCVTDGCRLYVCMEKKK